MSEVIRQLASAEYGALAVAAGPVTAAVVGWLLRQIMLHLRDARARAYVTQLVAWAQQTIPDKSERYAQVATLLSQRFPGLPASDAEVLIESEVHALKQVSTGSAQPAIDSAQPAAGSAQPAIDSAQPAAGSTQPAADSAQPSVGTAQPAAGSAQPLTAAAPAAVTVES